MTGISPRNPKKAARLKPTDFPENFMLCLLFGPADSVFNVFFNASGITDGGQRGGSSPGKLNVKTGPPLSFYFGFSIFLVFSRLLFFAVFGTFLGDLRF